MAWAVVGSGVAAQSPADEEDRTGRIVPLDQGLEQLSTAAEVSLVYDVDLVQGYYTSCAVEVAAPEATLGCMLSETDLDYVQTSGGTYVVKTDVRRPPRRGDVTGRVRDAEAKTPLSQAHVRGVETSHGTVTDRTGRFHLSGLVSGPHTLVVSHLGYEPDTITVRVRPEGTVRRTIGLAPARIAIDSIVVDAPEVSSLTPSRERASLSPAQLGTSSIVGTPSIPHAAGTLMGITTQAPYADLHVQGSANNEHEVRLDGVPVRNPAATGRLLGAFSSLALDGLTARKAGFGALQGDALSGVLQLEHDLERPDTRYATVRADPVSVDARTEGTVNLGNVSSTAMAAGRMGLWDVHQSDALTRLIDTWSVLDPVLTAAQLSSDTLLTGHTTNRRARPKSRLYDLHGAVQTVFASGHHLYVSGYHGRSRLGADLISGAHSNALSSGEFNDLPEDGRVEFPTSDQYEWMNTVAQATYEAALSPRTTGRLQASLSRYRADSRYELGRVDFTRSNVVALSSVEGASASNGVIEVGVKGTMEMEFSGRQRLILTGGVTSLDSRFRVANAFVGHVRGAGQSTRLAAAGQAELGLGTFTTLEGGLRFTARPDRGGFFAEPRVALQYHRPQTSIGEVAARIGGGLYRQSTTQFELTRDGATSVVPTAQVWMPVPEGLTPPRTYHAVTDLSWGPHPAWSVAVEGYGKWQPHLLAVDYPALLMDQVSTGPAQVLSTSRGRSYGGGVRVSYEGSVGTSTLRYTYSRSRRTFPGRFEGRMVPAPWNEPHRLSVDARAPLGEVFALELRGNGIWGRRWGYQRAYYAYLSSSPFEGREWEDVQLDRPETHVLPPLYRFDVGLSATHSWGDVNVTGRVGLVNVFGRSNVADWGFRPRGEGDIARRVRTLPGRRSVLSFQIRY